MKGMLVYPLSVDHEAGAGIIQKMIHQTAAFRALNVDVTQVHGSRRGVVANGELVHTYRPRGANAMPLHHHSSFYIGAYRVAQRLQPDFLYIRYPLATPFFVSLLAALRSQRRSPRVVLEVPTYPYRAELTSARQRLLGYSDDILRHALPKLADLVVTFYGQERIFGLPCYKTTNGISTEHIVPRRTRPLDGPIRAIAVANVAEWHGYDRFLHGMATASASQRVELDVVGDGPAKADLVMLTERLGLRDRVHFHGILRGDDLDRQFELADVAVGSLGHHRLGLPIANSLKAREYCARGIPFVMATPDPDFPRGHQEWHEFVADESPLDMRTVVDLALAARRDATVVERMRRYAEAQLTWEAKLAPLVARLRDPRTTEAPLRSQRSP